MDPENELPVGEVADQPVVETPETPADTPETPEPAEGAATESGAETEQPQQQQEPPTVRVPQSVQKRIDKLSYDAKSAAERAEAAEARAAALQALLDAQGVDAPVSESAPQTATEDQINARAAQLVAQQAFDQKCNAAYEAGEKAFGKDGFGESIAMLHAVGVMNMDFLSAAMETSAPERVLHALGQDPDEAARIANLPTRAQAIALDRLATRLAAPQRPQVSQAPAPIKTLDGQGKAQRSVYDPDLTDDEYYAMRAKEREAHFANRR